MLNLQRTKRLVFKANKGKSVEDCEDIFSDVLLKLTKYNTSNGLFIKNTIRSSSAEFMRDKYRKTRVTFIEEIHGAYSECNLDVDKEFLNKLISTLPKTQKQVIMTYLKHEGCHIDTAKALNMNYDTAKANFWFAVKALKKLTTDDILTNYLTT